MFRSALLLATVLTALCGWSSSADAQGLAARTQPNRDGLTLMGGGWFPGNRDTNGWFRAEVDIHLRRMTRADLYLQIPMMISHRSYGAAGNRFGWTGVALVPGVRGEWTLLNRKGDLALFLEGGAGIVFYSWNYDDCAGAGTCGVYDNDLFGLVRTGAGLSYTAPFGLIVSAQPFGFGWAIGDGYNDGAYWDTTLMLGYRWE